MSVVGAGLLEMGALLSQCMSGMSSDMCGNGTHQGNKGKALTVSVQGVRDGLLEKVSWHTCVNTRREKPGNSKCRDLEREAGTLLLTDKAAEGHVDGRIRSPTAY